MHAVIKNDAVEFVTELSTSAVVVTEDGYIVLDPEV
jgi:hypothetical protein